MPVPTAARPPSAPSSGTAAFVWSLFAAAFAQAYRCRLPFEGAGKPWPRGTAWFASRTPLPTADANEQAIAALLERCADEAELRARVERMFRHPVHVRAGISLERVVAWWPSLASDEAFAQRSRLLGRAS